jgi:hypothetical protein
MITEIVELMKKDRSEASMKDLENALGILRYKS